MNGSMEQAVRQVLGLACRAPGSAPVNLSFGEFQFWPEDAIEKFRAARLLRPATPGDHVQCRGCEEYCLRPVQESQPSGGTPTQLVTTCHLFSSMGPFFHPKGAADRWSTSRRLILEFVRSQCSLEIAETDKLLRRIRFRTVENSGVRRTITLDLSPKPTARIGDLAIPLEALIVCDGAGISLDKSYLADCFMASDEPKSGGKTYQISRTIQESNKLLNEIRDQRLQSRLDQFALEHPNLNKEQLAAKVSKEKQFAGLSVGRIQRVTRMPPRKSKK